MIVYSFTGTITNTISKKTIDLPRDNISDKMAKVLFNIGELNIYETIKKDSIIPLKQHDVIEGWMAVQFTLADIINYDWMRVLYRETSAPCELMPTLFPRNKNNTLQKVSLLGMVSYDKILLWREAMSSIKDKVSPENIKMLLSFKPVYL